MEKMTQVQVRIPALPSIGKAIEIYYRCIELRSSDVKELFGKISGASVVKLKGAAREKQAEMQIPIWNAGRVNTQAAYAAWGLDIKDLEQRYAKLKKMGLEA